MADFQETARIKIKELSSTKASVRREAAYYLGEAGVDESITKLATLYKNDPDKSVRKAAGYALGMFKAVEEALNDGREEEVVTLLRGVVEEGKMGRRLKTGTGTFVFFEFVLILLLAGLIAANLLMPELKPLPFSVPGLDTNGGGADTTNGSTMNAEDRAALIEGMRPTYQGVFNDANALVAQYQRVIGGSQLDCTAFFNNVPPYAAPPMLANADADLRAAAETINAAQVQVTTSHTRFDQACFDGVALEIADVGGQLGPLTQTVASLSGLQPLFGGTGSSAPPQQPAPTAEIPQPTAIPPTATPIPETPTPTVIVPIIDVNQHLQQLFGIVDRLHNQQGPHALVSQYWRDAQNAGVTTGCDQPQPEIPQNYVLTSEEAATLPDLAQAANQVNIALDLTRQNWQLFQTACSSGQLSQQANTGLQITSTVEEALRVADELLRAVQNSQ